MAATSFEQACMTRLSPTRIEVLLDAPSIRYDNSTSVAELSAKKEHGPGWRTLGLTVMETNMTLDSGTETLTSSDGQACFRPHLKVVVTAFPQTVYVAREFKPGTCAYQEILAHEMRHVQVNVTHTRQAVGAFESELRKAFGNDVYIGREKSLHDDFLRALKTGWLPNLKARLSQSDAQHAQIDTPQEYARMSTVCSGEVGHILQGQRR
jgi:hypothetical protein